MKKLLPLLLFTTVKALEICHMTDDGCITIDISNNSLNSHLAHGDFTGPCTDTCDTNGGNIPYFSMLAIGVGAYIFFNTY